MSVVSIVLAFFVCICQVIYLEGSHPLGQPQGLSSLATFAHEERGSETNNFPVSPWRKTWTHHHPQLSRESSDLQLYKNKANNPNNNDNNKMAGIQNYRQPQNTIQIAITHNGFGCNGEAMLPGMSRDTIKGSMLTHILKAWNLEMRMGKRTTWNIFKLYAVC